MKEIPPKQNKYIKFGKKDPKQE